MSTSPLSNFHSAIKTVFSPLRHSPKSASSAPTGLDVRSSPTEMQETPKTTITSKEKKNSDKTWLDDFQTQLNRCYYHPDHRIFFEFKYREGIYGYEIVKVKSIEVLSQAVDKYFDRVRLLALEIGLLSSSKENKDRHKDIHSMECFIGSKREILLGEFNRLTFKYSQIHKAFNEFFDELHVFGEQLYHFQMSEKNGIAIYDCMLENYDNFQTGFEGLLTSIQHDLNKIKMRKKDYETWMIEQCIEDKQLENENFVIHILDLIGRTDSFDLTGSNHFKKDKENVLAYREVVRQFYNSYVSILDFHEFYFKGFERSLNRIINQLLPGLKTTLDRKNCLDDKLKNDKAD